VFPVRYELNVYMLIRGNSGLDKEYVMASTKILSGDHTMKYYLMLILKTL
jgi:hypothetical protein